MSFDSLMALDLNQQLLSFYEKNIGCLDVVEEAKTKLSSPLLMLANETYYLNPDRRVIVWGQETNGWGTCFKTYQRLIEQSPKSAALNRMSGHYEFLQGRYNSVFWRAFCELAQVTQKSELLQSSFLWGNVFALDYAQGSILKKVPKDLKENVVSGVSCYSEKMFRAEIEILKPRIMVFFTGLNGSYDRYLKLPKDWSLDNIGSLPECKEKKSPCLGWVKTFELDGIRCFKTYHPGYLSRLKGLESIKIISDTIQKILKIEEDENAAV